MKFKLVMLKNKVIVVILKQPIRQKESWSEMKGVYLSIGLVFSHLLVNFTKEWKKVTSVKYPIQVEITVLYKILINTDTSNPRRRNHNNKKLAVDMLPFIFFNNTDKRVNSPQKRLITKLNQVFSVDRPTLHGGEAFCGFEASASWLISYLKHSFKVIIQN